MTRRIVRYDENFLVECSKEILINPILPFKLQKRELLEKLGFPIDDSLVLPIQDYEQIERTLLEYDSKKMPFLLGIHLKPMPTYITPFFLIKGNRIKFRNEFGDIQFVTPEEMLERIRKFPLQSWVEFIRSIWGDTTIMGRIIYLSLNEQLIEIQKGITPDELGEYKEGHPYFTTELYSFGILDRVKYRHRLLRSGFKITEVENIISSLKKYIQGFESLKQIANLPTLEFGYTIERELVVVDIDWPSQYQY